MAYKIIKPEDAIEARPLVVVIYGRPGVGKTSLCFTAANPFLMDFNNGLARAVRRKKAAHFDTWADVKEFLKSGHLAPHRGGTLVIDTAKDMLDDYIGTHLLQNPSNRKKGGGLSQTGFGVMKAEFGHFLQQTREYAVDVVFIAHMQAKEEGDQTIFVPAMTGGSFDTLVGKADLIGFMETRNNRRVLDFNPSDRFIAKNTGEFQPIDIPHYSDPLYGTLLADILDAARERMTQVTAEQAKAVGEGEAFREELSRAQGLAALNEMAPRLAHLASGYQAPLAEEMSHWYYRLFREQHLEPIGGPPGEALEALSGLVPELDKVPERVGTYEVRRGLKKLLNDHATALELEWDKGAKKFRLASRKPADAAA